MRYMLEGVELIRDVAKFLLGYELQRVYKFDEFWFGTSYFETDNAIVETLILQVNRSYPFVRFLQNFHEQNLLIEVIEHEGYKYIIIKKVILK